MVESLQVALGGSKIRYELIMPFDWYPHSQSVLPDGTSPTPAARSGLLRAAGTTLPNATGPIHTGFKAYHLARIPQNSTSAQRHAAAVGQAWGYISAITDSPFRGSGANFVSDGVRGGLRADLL